MNETSSREPPPPYDGSIELTSSQQVTNNHMNNIYPILPIPTAPSINEGPPSHAPSTCSENVKKRSQQTWMLIKSTCQQMCKFIKTHPYVSLTAVVAIALIPTLTILITRSNNCNKYYPENCRNCDEFSYWYNFDKTTPLETNVNNWNDIDLNNFYDPTNGECKNFKCSCVNGIPLQNMCTKESQQKCETCNNGFYLTKSSECLKQRCFCENGSVDDHCQSTTPKQKCKSCHYGYHLTHSGVCQLNDCFCDYGATSSICPMNGISNCGFCHSTFMLLHAQCICPSAMTIKSRKCEPTGDIQINLKLIKPTGGFTTPWQEYLVDSAGKVLDDNEQLELYFKLSFGEFVRNTKVIKTNSQTDVLNFGYSVSSTKFYENLDVGGSYFAIELFEEDFFSSNEMAFKFQYGSVVFMEQFKRTGLVGFKDDVGKDGAVKFEFEILVHK